MREINFKEKYLIFLIVICLVLVGIYYSYAIFVTKQLQENVVAIETIKSDVEISYNGDNVIMLSNNDSGEYVLTIDNKGKIDAYYEVFFKGGKNVQVSLIEGDTKGQIKVSEKKQIKIAIENFSSEADSLEFVVKSSIYDNIEKEISYRYINKEKNFDHSNANYPNLDGLKLIPVVYHVDQNGHGSWNKADKTNQKSMWYSYENGNWANAVLVTDRAYDKYLYADVGSTIEFGDVIGYYVWIPRFKYVVLNNSNYTNYERLYNVLFEKGINSTGTIICEDKISDNLDEHLYSEKCQDIQNERIYDNLSTYTHPAFQDKEGFWVAKFLMSEGNNIVNSIPLVPYLKKTVDSAITLSESMINNRSHLMTNMEYGSIAILANSEYGKSSNYNFINENNYSFKRIYVNGYELGYTGCSSDYDKYSRNYLLNETEKCIEYNDLNNYSHVSNGINYPIGEVGPGASSTGTVYGVYDLVNKNGELVAAFGADKDGNSKYTPSVYDLYSYNEYIGRITSSNNVSNLYRYKLGDGIKENFRSFSLNSMWQGGVLEQKDHQGVLLRGGNGNIKEASPYTASFQNDEISAPFRVCIM